MAETLNSAAVDQARSAATDYLRSHRWADVLALEPALRDDREYWVSVWAAACAIASWHEGRPDARDLLEECISEGFHDLLPLGDLFENSFGTEPDWPALRARIAANVPLPPVELLRWPCSRPTLSLGLSRLDAAGEGRLASRLPELPPDALGAAELLLGWVTNRWRHSGANHDPSKDANVVLDRVEGGDRFACVEYTIVLTQALNAMRIPARPIAPAGPRAGRTPPDRGRTDQLRHPDASAAGLPVPLTLAGRHCPPRPGRGVGSKYSREV
jgi:hypothetical protein